jgi:hypothetical protein
LPTADKSKFSGFFSLASDKSASPVSKSLLSDDSGLFFSWRSRKKISIAGYEDSSYFNPLKLALYQDSVDYPEGFWYLAEKVSEARRRKFSLVNALIGH